MTAMTDRLIAQATIQDALLTKRAEVSLRAYIEQAWPILEPDVAFVPNWHIDFLAEHLEAVTAGESRRLLINIPPRYMKSLLVSVLWPTWEWIHRPGGRWICASYSDALSTKHSLDRRTILQSAWYQARWGDRVQLASDQNVKGEFQNTKRGVMIATSTGGLSRARAATGLSWMTCTTRSKPTVTSNGRPRWPTSATRWPPGSTTSGPARSWW